MITRRCPILIEMHSLLVYIQAIPPTDNHSIQTALIYTDLLSRT